MSTKASLILLVFFHIALLGMAKQNLVANPEVAQARCQSVPVMNAAQAQSLRDDLNKMRRLVQQMETNLSFVDTTQSPLKHQFQLEIDMWKLAIQRMDRELQGSK